jgi:hypothetical protein
MMRFWGAGAEFPLSTALMLSRRDGECVTDGKAAASCRTPKVEKAGPR